METNIYNKQTMTIFDLKNMLENFPLEQHHDFLSIKQNDKIKNIEYTDIENIKQLESGELKITTNNQTILTRSFKLVKL